MDKDKIILRNLCKKYKDVVCDSRQKVNEQNWRLHNSLKSVKPMISIDQIPWHQMNQNNELDLLCTTPFCRNIEYTIRENLYKWNHFSCDMVIPNFIRIAKSYTNTGIGVNTTLTEFDKEHKSAETHLYQDQLPDIAAINRLCTPQILYDKDNTLKSYDFANDLIGDIIPIKLEGVSIWAAVWDRIVFLRGATPVLYDLIDRPEYVHELMKKMMAIEMDTLTQYENQNLLEVNPGLVHCSGAYVDELPKSDFDENHVTAKHCWVSGAAQIFSEVSPTMHDEFEIEYLKPYYERFGLVNYGCCEPLHNKIDIIRKIKNIRKISISPWADVNIAAEAMKSDYIMARKPNPAFVAQNGVDIVSVKTEIRETLKACYKNNTCVEFILKDITTVQNDPQRLTTWYELVKAEIENF